MPKQVKNQWDRYYQITQNRPPSPLLIQAETLFGKTGKALDLGSGAGVDAKYLLDNGFTVTAVDNDDDAIERLHHINNPNLTVIKSTYDAFHYEVYDLVNASWALPFNPKLTFTSMVQRLIKSIKKDGYFSGHLFGINDEWNRSDSNMTFQTRGEAEHIFDDLELINFEEVEKDGKTANGTPKHWHVFHIVARV